MRGPLSKCESPSYFFKFIKPELTSQLSIPKSFRKYIKNRRNNKTAILKRGCQKWSVKIIDWVFSKGWDNFVTENDVQEFDFVVFKHERNMVFNIMVFDNTWCEREYLNNQVTESSKKCKIDTNALEISKGKDEYISKSTKSLPIAEKRSKTMVHDQNQHPSFVGTLKQYARRKKIMYLSNKFALANGLSSGEMILKNVENEGLWTVKLRESSGRPFVIEKGLREFCSAIGLKKGDSFRFELIRKGKKPVAIVSRLPKPKAALINPNFRSIVTASTIKNACVNVPLGFARLNKLDERNCELFVTDEKQRLWTTRLFDSGVHVLVKRVRDMLVANGLKEGDEFLLELLDNGKKPKMNLLRHKNTSV